VHNHLHGVVLNQPRGSLDVLAGKGVGHRFFDEFCAFVPRARPAV
jgi:hypothetical protein